jgi:hypothetical protein
MRALLVLLLLGGVAHAQERPRTRSIAVLEFRAGSARLPEIAMRLGRLLKKGTSHRIVDLETARAQAGVRLDESVARCGGEPRCIAGIGQRLGVEEVLLVGVSELGDVLVAIQRVDSKTGRVLGRTSDSLQPGSEPGEAALEGYLKRLLPPGDFLRWGTLRIRADVEGATVEVDGKPRGVTPLAPIQLTAPSTVDVRVTKSGRVDYVARVDIVPDAAFELRPVLPPKPARPITSRWWFWAAAGLVVAGTVTTIVVLTDDPPSTVPIEVEF